MEEKNFIWISGEKLAFFRDRKGITQKELAKLVEVSRATIVTWEGKERLKIKKQQLEKLTKLLNITHRDLTNDKSINAEGDLLDHPLVRSFADQINTQKEIIEMLKRELADCRGGKK